MKTKNKVQPGLDWTSVDELEPNEKELVLTRRKTAYGFTEPMELRRKGEFWFFPDWSQKIYNAPTQWKSIVSQ